MAGDATVLVFGATGAQGGSTARALLRDGWRVRAFARDPESKPSRELAARGAEVVRGDMRDAASIERAMQGVYGVFSMQPSSGQPQFGVTDADELNFGTTIVDLAKAAGVQHLIYTSVAGNVENSGIGHFESKWKIEEYVRSSGVRYTIIRPGSFMEFLLEPLFGLPQRKLTFVTAPDQRISAIAVDDIGPLATYYFNERIFGKTIDLAGDWVSGATIAEKISRAIGEKVTYSLLPDALVKQVPLFEKILELARRQKDFGNPDVAALRKAYPGLRDLDTWLAETGARAIKALQPDATGAYL